MRALFAGRLGVSSVRESLIIVGALTILAMTWPVGLFARSVQ